MGLLINQLLDLQSDKELKYVYIFKIKLVRGKNSKIVYSVGHCSEEPVVVLQSMLYNFYKTHMYLPQAKVLKAEQSSDYEHITKLLQYELLDNRFHFQGLSNVYSINDKELLDLYHTHIPNRDSVQGLEELMPSWAYSGEEIKRLQETSLDMDETYRVVKLL